MHTPAVSARIQANRRALRVAAQDIAAAVPILGRIPDLLAEFDNNWYRTHTNAARAWVGQRIDEITTAYHLAEQRGVPAANSAKVKAALMRLWEDSDWITPLPDV